MLSRWPIRTKLGIGIALLLITLSALALSSFRGVYAFRNLAKSISERAKELPLSLELAQEVGALQAVITTNTREPGPPTPRPNNIPGLGEGVDMQFLGVRFNHYFDNVQKKFEEYRDLIEEETSGAHIGDKRRELQTVRDFQQHLDRITDLEREVDWVMDEDTFKLAELRYELQELHELSRKLPGYLQQRMLSFADDVRLQYRAWIAVTWATSTFAVVLLFVLARLFYAWVFRPLRTLIHGSRRVAAGEFDHRIQLDSQDEVAELAAAMNHMTSSFQEIRDRLDEQVRQRTREVIRGEQLASVGFLAAGVAHEINNPLQSIALCSESLEERLHDIIQADDNESDEQHKGEIAVLRTYLRMIQDEAFRCKEITERLLDFSRMGEVEKQTTDLCDLVRGVIDMVRHLGKYKEKTVEFLGGEAVIASVNPQEMKQVVLNLITNGLESLKPGGKVLVDLIAFGPHAKLIVQDDGCGMTDEVKEHLFEPFFTRRSDGQGTGLGMSITYRIINEHHGQIDVYSDGPNTGSTLTVWLPRMQSTKETQSSPQKRLAA